MNRQDIEKVINATLAGLHVAEAERKQKFVVEVDGHGFICDRYSVIDGPYSPSDARDVLVRELYGPQE